MSSEESKYELYRPPIPGCYYLLIERGKPPILYWEDPIKEPHELKGKRLIRITGERLQERQVKGTIMSWIDIEGEGK